MNDTHRTTLQLQPAGATQKVAGELPIPIFYSPAMVADSESFSPSA